MSSAINIIQIASGVILIGLILLQSKGTGIGSTFGGDMGFYATKRGAEKMLFVTTLIVSVIFLLTPILNIFL